MSSSGTRQPQKPHGEPSHFYESILWKAENVAVAMLNSEWLITSSNAAFKMIIGIENADGMCVADLVSADDSATWAQHAERMFVEVVLLNYQRADGNVTSMRSRLYAVAEGAMLVGEIPVYDLIAAEEVMRTLNNEITTLARENARKSRQLEAKSKELAIALQDLETSYWHLKKIQEVLPICMYCHKVKSSANQWEDVADYLKENSLFLSHGLCPSCVPLYGKN